MCLPEVGLLKVVDHVYGGLCRDFVEMSMKCDGQLGTMPRSFEAVPGRTVRATDTTGNRLVPVEAKPPPGFILDTYEKDEDGEDGVPEEETSRGPVKKPLRVKKVNCCIEDNTLEHHTSKYEITQFKDSEDGSSEPGKLVVRRGQPFEIALSFDRTIDENLDEVKLVFDIGSDPLTSKGTYVVLPVTKGLRIRDWGAAVKSASSKSMNIIVQAPCHCAVGKWNLRILTKMKVDHIENGVEEDSSDEDEPLQEYKTRCYDHKDPVYILFNPWCREDLTYMEDEVLLEEYVLNDTGKVYTGNYKQIWGRPWNFDQFEDVILDCALLLLDMSKLNWQVRGDPILLSRTISAVTNSPDDMGVLVGNWSGNYEGGTSPSAWTGSGPILEEFWKTRTPVQFGQCWVFSGVVTTICRALGLPARPVTNFRSGHDCDGSITLDTHWTLKGEPIERLNSDSIWNFHVWNEVWMARPDLPPGFGGWQIIDATPQETSNGIYCAGPCSVNAIKQGLVNLPYDAPFVFAEVNADKINWCQKKDGTYKKMIDKHRVGKRISTKWPAGKPKPADGPRDRFSMFFKDDPERDDLTHTYKFKEGSEEERTAVYKANQHSCRPGVYDFGEPDVKFEIQQKDNVLVGSPFEATVKIQNKSRQVRHVRLTITVSTQYYTGVYKGKVKAKSFNVELQPIKSTTESLKVVAEDYLHLLLDQVAFKISVMAKVKETKQVYCDDEDFRLRRPGLQMEVPHDISADIPFPCHVKLENSMPVALTQCEWRIQGPGLQKLLKIPHKDIEPYDRTELHLTLTPRVVGIKPLVVTFTSKELQDVSDVVLVHVR